MKDVRTLNRSLVFFKIREAVQISRADLAKSLSLNPATVTHIVRELLEKGLIEEAGRQISGPGRPSAVLRINSQMGYIIGIQLDRYFIHGMMADFQLQNPIYERFDALKKGATKVVSIPALLDLIATLIDRAGPQASKILGIGIGAPGPLDEDLGLILSPPNFPGWPGTNICQIVEDKFHLPTFLDRDASACALAEKWFGHARDLDDFFFILSDAGLGGAFFTSDDVLRGKQHIAGEIGHTSIDINGPLCDCGNYGCLELYTAPGTAEARVRKALSDGKVTMALDLANGDPDQINFATIVQASTQGDELCRKVILDIAGALSTGIVNVANAFDPQAIIIGGEITIAGNLLLDFLRENVHKRNLTRDRTSLPILFSQFGKQVSVIGAASIVLQRMFKDSDFYETLL